jgi:hypothetical protein
MAGVAVSGLVGGTQPGENTAAPAKTQPKGKPAPKRGGDVDDLLRDVRARIQIAEQQLTQAVQEKLRQARQVGAADPDASLRLLRETLAQVRDDPDVGDRVRDDLLREIVAIRLKLKQPGKQPVWTLDFRFKEPRLVVVNIPGKGRKVLWYWWYQVSNPTDEPHTFIPHFELVAGEKVHIDKVLPRADEAVRRLEDPTHAFDIKNSQSIARRPIPPARRAGLNKNVVGVAFWEDVPPNVKSFSLFVGGLSNAWSFEDAPAGLIVREKVLRVRFRRVDDKFLHGGGKLIAEGRPEWSTGRSRSASAERNPCRSGPGHG